MPSSLSVESVLAMQPGAKLNNAVHIVALGLTGKAKAYSTNAAEAVEILKVMPIYAGRVPVGEAGHDETRPFVGGVLNWPAGSPVPISVLSVRTADLSVAICKAALLHVIQPRDRVVVPAPAPALQFGGEGRENRPQIPHRPKNFIAPRPVDSPAGEGDHGETPTA